MLNTIIWSLRKEQKTMNETREQYLERIINGSTAYINVKERREEKTTEQIINDYVGVLNQILEILNMETLEDEELHYVKHSLRKRFEGSILLGI